jgi:hypothetical protein
MRSVVTYRSGLTDSSRWQDFRFRSDDIVISTPSKCGTTWAQMLCALLIFQTADLPAPLTRLSPWLDMRLRPADDVLATLAGQRHRRFIKTHTPVDGLPVPPGVTVLTVGRDPRDVAVSLEHHRCNLDRDVIETLLARSVSRPAPHPADDATRRVRPTDRRGRILQWIHDDVPPTAGLDSLAATVGHLGDAWARRHERGIVVLHHADLLRDLEAGMRTLADRLGIAVAEYRWPALVHAATIGEMRVRAADLAPHERLGLFTDDRAFFRSGAPGQWRDVFTVEDLDAYDHRLRALASPELVRWLEHGDTASPDPGRSDAVTVVAQHEDRDVVAGFLHREAERRCA